MAGDDTKLDLFHGNGTDDPEQYWFLCEAVWIAKQTTDDGVKKGQLETTLWGCALDWYMKFIQVSTGTPTKTLNEVRKGLIKEFQKPKSEAQYITELKEIKQFPNEIVWDFDQRFKTLMERVIFELSDVQHKEWFIAALVSHIWQLLMQHKTVTQREALEIAMKLEASPIGESAPGMNQIEVQLANLALQLQDIKKGKENHKYLWCTRCHVDGHTKDTCPNFQNYLLSGGMNPLSCKSVP